MSLASTFISFGEWLPDQPELGNPGLTEAKNVMPKDLAYAPFNPLQSIGYTALAARPLGGIWAYDYTNLRLYVGNSTALGVMDTGTGAFTNLSAVAYSLPAQLVGWSFTQFDELVIAATPGYRLQRHTIGSSTAFTVLSISGEAPYSERVGKIGRFVFALNNRQTTTASVDISARWSAVDDGTNWPTPNSSTATATQSGEQFLDAEKGKGTGVSGDDQYGLIFQERAITRVTYAGPPVVFQFDKISSDIGCTFPNTIVHVAGKYYFWNDSGIYVTDGVSVQPLGNGRVDNWLINVTPNANFALDAVNIERIYGAADIVKKVIMWGYPTYGVNGAPNNILIYNYEDNRFSWATENHEIILPIRNVSNLYTYGAVTAFDSDSGWRPSYFASTPAVAILTTGESELNPGGFARITGVRPVIRNAIIGGVSTTVTATMAIGTRAQQSDLATYTAETSPTPRTEYCDFRSESKYHRARLSITGAFGKASGVEFKAIPSGET